MTDQMSAEAYRKLVGAPDDTQAEMDAAVYRRMIGAPASEFLHRRNLDSSHVNTESPAKRDFAEWLLRVSPLPVVTEYQFHPKRRWRADWCILGAMLIFEYDGVMHHSTKAGQERDAAKGNEAQLLGYLFLRVNAGTVRDGSAYDVAVRAFALRGITV